MYESETGENQAEVSVFVGYLSVPENHFFGSPLIQSPK